MKSALREIAGLFSSFFGEQFSEARYDKIHKWCVQQYGAKDDLSKLIEQDHELWIKQIVRMRNAVEHPGGYAGHLHVHNFETLFFEGNHATQLIESTWHLNDEPQAAISHDLIVCVSNALEFVEDLSVVSLGR